MPESLSYPALKIVIEFLDPIKRIHITRRSASLRRIDKSIPIRVEDLSISHSFLYLDDEGIITEPEMNFYLTGRQSYVAKCVTLGGPSRDITFPPDFKIITKELISEMRYFVKFLPIIDQSSFPLRRLLTEIEEPAQLDHPVLRSVDELEIETGFDGMVQYINENIKSKTVIFAHEVPADDFLTLIKNWMKNGKELGTTYKFFDFEASDRDSLMWKLKKNFSKFENERYDETPESPIFIIPIDKTASCINVYSVELEDNFQTILKIEYSKQKRGRSGSESVYCKKARK